MRLKVFLLLSQMSEKFVSALQSESLLTENCPQMPRRHIMGDTKVRAEIRLCR